MKATKPGTAAPRPTSGERPAATPPKFFTLIPANPGIDFVKQAPMMTMVSVVFILVGLVSVWWRGLNYGIDFEGGTMVQVRFEKTTAIGDVRDALDAAGLRGISVQDVGSEGHEFQIRAQGEEGDETAGEVTANTIKDGLAKKFGEGTYETLRIETVGPKVGKALWRDAGLAVLVATIMMGIYIAFRFDLRFGIGAAVALAHDVLFTIGALSLANMEIDLTTVAALLTIVGFSVNDTVIISDRIRENMRLMRKDDLRTIVNTSINETLSRTIITNTTAVLVVAALFLFGGDVIHSFAFALLVGFIAGTYSTIYIASPLVLFMERGRAKAA
ncbi:MAG: protein translocase subunit SecF [bacterium]|nr:protein translocase subunit SecF [bacterium]